MNPDEPAWTVEAIRDARLRARLKRWVVESLESGTGPSYQEAIAEMRRGLTTDPLAWGDPLFESPALGTTTLHRGVSPLHVTYTVNLAARVVWVMDIKPYNGSGLSED